MRPEHELRAGSEARIREHLLPAVGIGMWPNSPAMPAAPRTTWPRSTTPPPRPVPMIADTEDIVVAAAPK